MAAGPGFPLAPPSEKIVSFFGIGCSLVFVFFVGLLKCVGRSFRCFVVVVVQSHCFMK